MAVKRIPAGAGFEVITEAVTTEYGQIMELVRQAVREKIRLQPGQSDYYIDLQGLFADRAVVRMAGRLVAYPYAIADGDAISVGEPVPVAVSYVPLREGLQAANLTEAADGSIAVTLIAAGLSKNGNFYPDAALADAVPLFEGVRVFVKSDAEHTKGGGKDVRNLLGGIYNVIFTPGVKPDSGRLTGTLRAIDPADPAFVKLTEAVKRGMQGLMGLSIDAEASTRREKRGKASVRMVQKFAKANSVDLIVEPGAGGALDRLSEAAHHPEPRSTTEEDFMKNRFLLALAAVSAAHAAAMDAAASPVAVMGKLTEACAERKLDLVKVLEATEKAEDDEAVAPAIAKLLEAIKPEPEPKPAPLREAKKDGDDAPVTRAELALHQARLYASQAVAGSTLPQAAKDKLQRELRARDRLTEAQVDQAITDEREYLARFSESGRATGGMPRIEVGDRTVQVRDMFDAFFDPKHKHHRDVRSIRECYLEVTGDRDFSGRPDRVRLTESIGTDTFADVLGNSMTRRLQQEYNDAVAWDAWMRVASVASVNDFRTQERTQFGGFGDLPTVAERAAYAALTDPSDDKSTYAVVKRGGLAVVTLEGIRNDDVNAIRRIPVELGRTAKRTLYTFCMNFFASNPTLYDSIALYHASHANLFTTALSAAQLSVHRLAMKKQVGRDTAKRMGIGPSMLLVPDDLEEAAVDLFRRNTNNDKNFVQSLSIDIIPVSTWTDVTDWVTLANPSDIPVLEIGFLDGMQEPTLLTQDNPTSGSVFTNDLISYKVRHVYGGNILVDGWKGTTKAVVAG